MKTECHRSLGLELTGARNPRSALVALDHYPQTARLVLAEMENALGETAEQSSDTAILAAVKRLSWNDSAEQPLDLTGLSVHAPLGWPPWIKYAGQPNAETAWLEEQWAKLQPKPRPFLPYLQRPVEVWLRHCSTERFQIPEALGANAAPLTARVHYLRPSLPQPLNESYPKAVFTRLVPFLNQLPRQAKRWPLLYTDMERGVETRDAFLAALTRKFPQIFIYERDLETLALELSSFQAFLSALGQHLIHRKQAEHPPPHFPKGADWIAIPRRSLIWDQIF